MFSVLGILSEMKRVIGTVGMRARNLLRLGRLLTWALMRGMLVSLERWEMS